MGAYMKKSSLRLNEDEEKSIRATAPGCRFMELQRPGLEVRISSSNKRKKVKPKALIG